MSSLAKAAEMYVLLFLWETWGCVTNKLERFLKKAKLSN